MPSKKTQPKTTEKAAVAPRTPVVLRSFTGTVASISGIKTIAVLVEGKKMHPKYKKQYSVSKQFLVHDEAGTAKVGDIVRFVSCRPLSARKRWRLVSPKA